MQRFASRDLMVNGLPEEPMDRGGECGPCTNCTDCTDQGTATGKVHRDLASDADLQALMDQLHDAIP